jgi:hypothetical protein
MAASLHRTPLLSTFGQQDVSSTAIINQFSGASFPYGSLLRDIARARQGFLTAVGGKSDLAGERIGFIVENGYSYVGKSPRPVSGSSPIPLSIFHRLPGVNC